MYANSNRALVVVLMAGLLTCWPLAAQRTTATISGTVTDSSGASVPSVTVHAISDDTGINQASVTDSQGRYRVAELPVGRYRVQVEKAGFQSEVKTGIATLGR